MNKPISAKDVAPPKVTTGPLTGSRKVYSSPQGHDDVQVPFREIALTDGSSFQVYDTSGLTPTPSATIDVQQRIAASARGMDRRARRCSRPSVTQLELARAGIVTKEMAYIAHRENIGRERAAEEADARLADGRASAPPCPRS